MRHNNILTVRCPIETIATLSIPFEKNGDFLYVTDPSALVPLRNSLFVEVTDDDKEIVVTETPLFSGVREGDPFPLPSFGYHDGDIVWVSRPALYQYEKKVILAYMPRAIERLRLIEIAESPEFVL